MGKKAIKLVVPHPETGEPISVDASTVKEIANDGDFSDLKRVS
ncbi:MAG: hypothetical protein ABEK50_11045 [bacterium]